VFGLITLMYLMTETFIEIKQATQEGIMSDSLMMKMSLWAFLFGSILEWKGLKRLLKRGIKINWLIIPALIIGVLSFVPRYYWTFQFGLGFPYDMFAIGDTQLLWNAASGVLLVRGLTSNS